MSKVVLVNPANATVGYSVITPRWLFVIAGATPVEFAGDPIIIDEPVEAFNPDSVGPGDIVGVGIHTGNCRCPRRGHLPFRPNYARARARAR